MTAGAVGTPAGSRGSGLKASGAAAAGSEHVKRASAPAAPPGAPPLDPPPFSVADIRRAIPEHLFERSAFWGFVHLFRDLAVVAALVAANAAVQGAAGVPAAVKLAVWPVYWYLAGAYLTGEWRAAAATEEPLGVCARGARRPLMRRAACTRRRAASPLLCRCVGHCARVRPPGVQLVAPAERHRRFRAGEQRRAFAVDRHSFLRRRIRWACAWAWAAGRPRGLILEAGVQR